MSDAFDYLDQCIEEILGNEDAEVHGKVRRALDFVRERGSHCHPAHTQWVLDQLVRILAGDDYEQWVAEYEAGEEGPDTHFWDRGTEPC